MLEKWLEDVDPSEKKLEEESENVVVQKIFINKHKLEEGIKFAKEDRDQSVEITIPKEVRKLSHFSPLLTAEYSQDNL